MRTSSIAAAVVISLGGAVPAWAQADLAAGTKALDDAYSRSIVEGAVHASIDVDPKQCRVEGSAVRCVIGRNGGHLTTEKGTFHDFAPIDFGIATFAPDGAITTRREAFTEPVVALASRLTVRSRPSLTRTGDLLVSVRAAVPAEVTVQADIGKLRGSRARRTVEVPGGRTTVVAIRLTQAQRDRVRRALRTRGSVAARIRVEVVGDVGPADATATYSRGLHIVRRR